MLYIHQFPDWTNFRFNEKKVYSRLALISKKLGVLLGSFSLLPKEIKDSFDFRKRETKALFEIDGNVKENATLLSAINNYQNPWSETRLLRLHKTLSVYGGKYRTDNHSELYSGVSFERIPAEMERFFYVLEYRNEDFLLNAAVFHFWFLTIKPFAFGNGIFARLLTDSFLSKFAGELHKHYLVFESFLNDKESYFKILNETQKGNGDITLWILWFLEKLEQAAEKSVSETKMALKEARYKLKYWNKNISFREQKLLELFFKEEHLKISSGMWAKAAQISQDSAARDLENLKQQDILDKTESKGRSTAYYLKELLY